MRACVYARKSTHKLGQKETIENQIKICRTKAKELSLDIVDIKQDTGTGTDDLNRPEVKKLIDDAKSGLYECVIMKGISRLYRDTEKGLGLIKLLDRHSIRVITIEEAFDSGNRENRTGTGKLDLSRITMYLMFSEMESKKLADRIKYTQIEKARNGEWNHAASTPFGYDFDPLTKKLKVNQLQLPTVRLIFNLYTSGLGMRSIMHHLNGENEEKRVYKAPHGDLWNQYTIGFILKNQCYIGDIVYNKRSKKERTYKQPELFGKTKDDLWIGNDRNNESEWIIKKNAHESIIDEKMFDSAQSIMSTKASRKGIKSNVGLLAGIAKCSLCGSGMTFKRGNLDKQGRVNTRNNYYCMNYIKYGKSRCESHHHRAEDLEDFIVSRLKEIYLDNELLQDIISNYKKSRDGDDHLIKEKINIDSEIKKLTEKMDKLLMKNMDGEITDKQFTMMNNKYSEELETLSQSLTNTNLEITKDENSGLVEERFVQRISEFKNIENMTKEDIRYLLLDLIKKAIVQPDGVVDMVYNL